MKFITGIFYLLVVTVGFSQETTILNEDESFLEFPEDRLSIVPSSRKAFRRPFTVVRGSKSNKTQVVLTYEKRKAGRKYNPNEWYNEIASFHDFWKFRDTHNPKVPNDQSTSKEYDETADFLLSSYYLDNHGDYIPLDNTIAVNSKDQKILGTNNEIILLDSIYPPQRIKLDAFFDNALDGACDPKILYDERTDRFMIFAQESEENARYSDPKVCLAVASKNGIYEDWSFYVIPGRKGLMFDYPRIAITQNDIIITGTEFSQNNQNPNQEELATAVLFQIEREEVLSNKESNVVVWKFWTESRCFMLPISSFDVSESTYDKPLILGAEWKEGSTNSWIYQISGPASNENSFIKASRYGLDYSIKYFGFARQPDRSRVDNMDLRIMNGFRIGDEIYYVNVNGNNNLHSKVRLNRLLLEHNVDGLQQISHSSKELGSEAKTSYMFPSVSWINRNGKPQIVSYYGGSSVSEYANTYCTICDQDLNCGDEWIVDASVDDLFTLDSNRWCNRWGDYTTIARHPSGNRLLFSSSSVQPIYRGSRETELKTLLQQFSFETVDPLASTKSEHPVYMLNIADLENAEGFLKLKLQNAEGKKQRFKVDISDFEDSYVILSTSLEGELQSLKIDSEIFDQFEFNEVLLKE